jgi:hypothetical protein
MATGTAGTMMAHATRRRRRDEAGGGVATTGVAPP